MSYPYEKNIAEIKCEFTTFLTNILTPFIYEGLKSVYIYSQGAHEAFLESGKYDPEIKSPGVLKLFQLSLKEIPTLNNNSIEIEANRIKSGSNCGAWFDLLVKATIKSHIVLLTFTNPKKRPGILKENHHEKVEVKDFIHKCYIESARAIYNNPDLFWHEYPKLTIKKNQMKIIKIIRESIEEAIRRMLPTELLLKEYLNGEYPEEDIYENINNKLTPEQYEHIKKLLEKKKTSKDNKSKSSTSRTEDDYMKDTHSYTYTEPDSASNTRSETSRGTESSHSNSSSDHYESKSEDDKENIKLFLKDIESQLHGLDNKMNAVKAVKEIPRESPNREESSKEESHKEEYHKEESHQESPKKDTKHSDNIFEKVKNTPVNNPIKTGSIIKAVSAHNTPKINDNKIEEPKLEMPKMPTPPPKVNGPINNVPNIDFNGDFLKQNKKPTKKEKMLMQEIEEQINMAINK